MYSKSLTEEEEDIVCSFVVRVGGGRKELRMCVIRKSCSFLNPRGSLLVDLLVYLYPGQDPPLHVNVHWCYGNLE